MAAMIQSTPQKPLPGAYLATPAVSRQFNQPHVSTQSPFVSASNQQNSYESPANGGIIYPQIEAQSTPGIKPSKSLSLIERAARTINTTLEEEARFPAIDSYVNQGHSSDYDVLPSSTWAPFVRTKVFDIPDKILDQYNQAQVSTMMGLFAEIHHAWVTIDNALYIWDYMHPNPEILGFEEQPNSITAVKLVCPRTGVFVESVSRLLVIATSSEIFLVGMAVQEASGGATSVSLYQTKMQVSVRGLSVHCLTASDATGRIFFAGHASDDIYEITYQQEERWFQNRCAKVNHTSKGFQSVIPTLPFAQRALPEHVKQIAIDDSRKALYTLSSRSTIRIFSLRDAATLELSLTRPLSSIMYDLGHKVGQTPLLSPQTSIASITPISDVESARLNLMATTSTGCRIFCSAVSGSFFGVGSSTALSSMQVHHVKFPPSSHQQTQTSSQEGPTNIQSGQLQNQPYSSTLLSETRLSERFPPGYFFCCVQRDQQSPSDMLFISAPDVGRIAHPQDSSQNNKFPEYATWVNVNGRVQDIGLASRPFAAASTPRGFGNELAVQFDQPTAEVAVLTNNGVHAFRRRRLVDTFVAALRSGGREEGLEAEIKNFVRLYGRGETIATVLAVACGQGSDISSDNRVIRVTDPEVLEQARKAFIDFGGRPGFDANMFVDRNAPSIEDVRPSPRHEGVALYLARLLRSIWKAPIIIEKNSPTDGLQFLSKIPLAKVQSTQRDLVRLQEFLNTNKTFIEGLAGPEALNSVSTKQDEVALQGEHRALSSLAQLINDVIEGISFVLVLFDERVSDIMLSLSDETRQDMRTMTYERLFCDEKGKLLAKELVKAIVNRNIATGSSVDAVTDALRRRCGSFCSADDCVIFKAQEQLKRASDSSSSSETSRNLLNESLKLLERVSGSLSMEQLQWAVEQYILQDFFAGAIQLCLNVARERDRGDRALTWFQEGSPGLDVRSTAFDNRSKCYDLIHHVVNAVDQASTKEPDVVDGHYTLTAKRRREAYDVVNNSQDELFQYNMYDWYLKQGWSDRLLETRSTYVITYLSQKFQEDVAKADLLWKYYANYGNFVEAAKVQLQLAKSNFELLLEQRIEYLSRARANASTKVLGLSEMTYTRQNRQDVLREISDLLDLATVQSDLLQRIKADLRVPVDRRPQVIRQLNGPIMSLDELYNGFADQASYHDICIIIYHIADYRNAADIRVTWQNLLESIHSETMAAGEMQPYEAISQRLVSLARRVHLSETIFPVATLSAMLHRYSFEYQRGVAPTTWISDLFMELSVPYESLVSALESQFYADEPPLAGRHRRQLASDLLHVVQKWLAESSKLNPKSALGGEENAVGIGNILQEVGSASLSPSITEDCEILRARIDASLR